MLLKALFFVGVLIKFGAQGAVLRGHNRDQNVLSHDRLEPTYKDKHQTFGLEMESNCGFQGTLPNFEGSDPYGILAFVMTREEGEGRSIIGQVELESHGNLEFQTYPADASDPHDMTDVSCMIYFGWYCLTCVTLTVT